MKETKVKKVAKQTLIHNPGGSQISGALLANQKIDNLEGGGEGSGGKTEWLEQIED